MRASFASMPRTQRSANERQPSASNSADSRQVMQDYRLVGVELEIALAAGERDGMVVAEHLHRDHRQRLALGRIDLARHDRRARLVFRQDQFADAGARTAGIPADVVGDLHQRASQGAQRAARRHHRIVRRADREEIGGLTERTSGFGRDQFAGQRAEPGGRIEAGADRRAAERQLVKPVERRPDRRGGLIELRDPARRTAAPSSTGSRPSGASARSARCPTRPGRVRRARRAIR